jgi:putrescine transport system substrate-binding protein
MMFTTGLGYNVGAVAERIDADKIGSWDMIFDPETAALLADCGNAVLDSPSEMIAPALNDLGIDPNSEDSGDLEKAPELMLSVRPHIRYFHSSQYINDLANGDICVSVGYSGDVVQARDRAAEADQGVEVACAISKEGGSSLVCRCCCCS